MRVSLLLGGALGVFANPVSGAQACDKFSNLTFAVVLLMVAFSPAKLLAFYEHTSPLAVGDWILMIWSMTASFFVQVLKGNTPESTLTLFRASGCRCSPRCATTTTAGWPTPPTWTPRATSISPRCSG